MMGLEELDESESWRPPKRPRQSRPKVKTGCFTCKNRRVKCDETRPECLRCQKSARKCNGYAVGVKGPPRPLAPRRQTLVARRLHPPLEVSCSPLSLGPSISLFHDETEARYFQVYCERTATKIGGYWEAGIWSHLILDACHHEKFARHAIISIGALDLAMEYQALQQRRKPGDQCKITFTDNPHHQLALQQYGKAIKLMRSPSSEDEGYHIRKALLSCLLIICFEIYRGDPDLAVLQAQSAAQVLTSWLRKLRDKGQPGSFTSSASGNSKVVEDEIINACARLFKAVMVFRAPRPIELSLLLMPEAAKKLSHMPSEFSSLKEAQSYWEFHLKVALPWNYQEGFEAIQASAFPKLYPDIIHDGQQGENPNPATTTQANFAVAKLDEERRAHLMNLERWRSAFAPIWTHSNTPAGSAGFQNAAILLLQSLCGTISFSAAASNEECVYDTFLPEFQQMAWLARCILSCAGPTTTTSTTHAVDDNNNNNNNNYNKNNNPSSSSSSSSISSFSFSVGVMSSIYFVLNKCRDPRIRRDLIQLCRAYPRRDAAWDSEMVAAVGLWHVEKEEGRVAANANAANATAATAIATAATTRVPESARVRLVHVDIPPAGKRRMVCIRYTIMKGIDPRERVMLPVETVVW